MLPGRGAFILSIKTEKSIIFITEVINMSRIIAIITAILMSVPCAAANVKKDSGDSIKAYVLFDCSTGKILEEKNDDERLKAGYLSKLMSILLIAESIENGDFSLEDELTASESVSGIKGSVIWLKSGDKLSADELIKSVIVGNANDALTVLAEKTSGTVEEFVMDMNAKAFDLGMRDTYFVSPYGYYDEREYTTAHDISVVCCKLSEFQFLEEYFCIWRDFVKEGQTELVNENTLARNYKKHCGFKAAHSDESGYCIAECGKSESGAKFGAVILGAESEDVSFSKAKELINRGMSDYRITAAHFPDDILKPVKVRNGQESAVDIELSDSGKIVVPKADRKLKTVFVIPSFLVAPLHKGQVIGEAVFYDGKEQVFQTDIIVKNDVNKLDFGYVLKKMLYKVLE